MVTLFRVCVEGFRDWDSKLSLTVTKYPRSGCIDPKTQKKVMNSESHLWAWQFARALFESVLTHGMLLFGSHTRRQPGKPDKLEKEHT